MRGHAEARTGQAGGAFTEYRRGKERARNVETQDLAPHGLGEENSMLKLGAKLSFFVFGVFFLSLNQASAGVEEYCADEWQEDFRMRQYCEDNQYKGQRELFSIAEKHGLVKDNTLSTSSTGGDHERIINRCMNEWKKHRFNTYDYRMVVHCIKKQFEAYSKVEGSKSKKTGIEAYCANEWPDDYQMRGHCEKKQFEGIRKLFAIAKEAGLVKDGTLSVSPNGRGIENIINYCMNEWEKEKFKTYDYNMVVYCIEKR
ncbi:MAG: hypothetical protein ACNS63_01080 [Candidatus Nitrospinota bacterium M3_3B_026]